MSKLKPAQRIPRLFKENEDLSPRISNAPSVRKYEAQEALSPLLNLALLASPAGAVSKALSYSPEAEGGFERAPSYIQKIVDKLRKADTPLETIRELLVREHGATLFPNGQAIVPTAPIRTVDQLPSYMNVIREKGIPGNASLKGGKTIALTEGSSPAEDIANINHEAPDMGRTKEFLDIADKLAGDPDYPLVAFRGVEDVLPDLTTGYQNQWMLNNIDEALRKGFITPILGKYAEGGTVKSTLQRYQESFPQRRAEANRQASVMSQADEAGWQPEYIQEPALEPPMISPDDLVGTGIPTKLAMLAKAGLGKGALAALGAGVIKNKGGNWLSGSVEGALGGLKKPWDIVAPGLENDPEVLRSVNINNWINRQLTRYVKNEMATPEDPVRALAERGVLHRQFYNQVPTPAHFGVGHKRVNQGFPQEGVASDRLARQWEELTDRAIDPSTAGSLRNPHNYLNETRRDKVIGGNPWLQKVPEGVVVFDIASPSHIDNLGFNHLIDELSNAINPGSGLPRNLQLDPKSLERVSVPQAVERVHGINLWRAAMKAEADQARANNVATVLHKEYPDKGMKWVELKAPEKVDKLDDAAYMLQQEYLGAGVSPERAYAEAAKRQNTKALSDALKYEGDTMGHCVGGYCEDVASGRSRIYSLRDAKGQPHVTIEVNPYGSHNDDIMFAELTDKLGRQPTSEELAEAMSVAPQRIVQIKGKQNRAPNPEYLPFVQDFVRSGKWSDVGDLGNAGLHKLPDNRYITKEQMEEVAARMRGTEYDTPSADWLSRQINRDPAWWEEAKGHFEGFAHGGSVEPNNATLGSVSPNKTLTLQDLSAIISALESGNQYA